MNILADFHHSDLFYSLQLLFEKRLEHQLYRPLGNEWYDKGFWKIAEPYNDNPGTIKQYLGLGDTEPETGIYGRSDKHNDANNKGITFEAFERTKFDIIIATIPGHIEPYKKLIREYQPQAKLIFQVGNIWWHENMDWSQIPNLMSSTIEYPVPSNVNSVFYHQEFDLDVFMPQGKKPSRSIISFINCLAQTGHGHYYYQLKSMIPEIDFRSYGGSCDDGVVGTTQDMSNIMNESMFGFHAKMYGDGFGHVLHNWFAVGKPVITCISDYKDKLAGKLLEDGVTCIDLDSHSLEEVCDIIRNISPLKYEAMCHEAFNRFKELVDYDKEAENIKLFLERLQ